MLASKFSVRACMLLTLCWANLVSLKNIDLTDETLAMRINAFGCNLLNGLYEDAGSEDNILVSPVNTFTTLGLVYLGAEGKTVEDLGAVMKLSDVKYPTEVHERLHRIVTKIAHRNVTEERKYFETALASGIFVEDSFPIKESYLHKVTKYYEGEVKNLDFHGHSEESTNTINDWFSRVTKGRIPKFYDSPISSDTSVVLTSGLYFNAKWSETFSKEKTVVEKFNTGSVEIDVPMMSMQTDMFYVRDDSFHYDSVSIPYAGREYEMTVYLQHTQHGDHGSLAHLFHKLTERKFYTRAASRALVHIKLPKMKFAFRKSIVDALKLDAVFKMAELGEMTSQNIEISDMVHATELEVDEDGTIASAATAAEIKPLSGFEPYNKDPIMFHVDRPFLMTITHKPTQAIVFAGIIRKPIS